MNTRFYPLVGALSLAFVVIIGWFAVVSPRRSDVSALKNEVTSARLELGTVKDQAVDATARKTTVSAAVRNLAHMATALPRSYAEPALIDTVQLQAKRDHVDFQGISFTPSSAPGGLSTSSAKTSGGAPPVPAAAGGAQTIGFSLTMAGNYFDMTRLVAQLQGLTGATDKRVWVAGRLLSFTGLTLSASKSQVGDMTATLDGNAYLLPTATAAAGVGSGAAN
jgi:hypothetical protein